MRLSYSLCLRVVGLAALLLVLACASRRGMEPEPERYRLYVGMEGEGDLVFAVDVASDSIIDSTPPRIFTTSMPLATPDGRYVLVQRVSAPTEVFSTAGLSLITELPGAASYSALALEDGLVLGVDDSCVSYYSYPDFGLVRTDTVRIDEDLLLHEPLEVDSERGLLYAHVFIRLPWYQSRTELLAWDYRNHEVHDRWDFADVFPGRQTGIRRFTLSPDRTRVYALCGTSDGEVLLCYALAEHRLIWETAVSTSLGYLQLTPDGRELWRTIRGFTDWPAEAMGPTRLGDTYWPASAGYVLIYDPATGAVTDSISMFGYTSDPTKPLPGREIAFTPDGRKAYVAASDDLPGPLFAIDVARHQITSNVFDDLRHMPYWLSIGPAP